MRKLLFFAAFLLNFAMHAQETTGTTVTVNISNIPGNEGKAIVSLFDEDTFMKAPPVKTGSAKIKDGNATLVFENVAPGEYGVISFHDENDNDRIDMEATGMPTEAYGVSNNPMSFGPPQWSEARFEVGKEPLSIDIRY